MSEDLEEFVMESTLWAEALMKELSWTKDDVMQAGVYAQCSHNKGHVVPKDKLKKHEDICPLLSRGYTKAELNKEESSSFYYENSNMVIPIHIDDDTMCNLLGRKSAFDLPKTVARSSEELTSEEKKRIYDYCRQCCNAISSKHKISEQEFLLLAEGPQVKSAPKSHLETLAEIRDMKRRRQSYKGKSTHTAGKSHKEVLRDVIVQQMGIIEETHQEEAHKEEILKEETHKEEKRRSRSRSSERSHSSRHKAKRKRSKDRSKDKKRDRSRDRKKEKKGKRKDKKRDRSREKSSEKL